MGLQIYAPFFWRVTPGARCLCAQRRSGEAARSIVETPPPPQLQSTAHGAPSFPIVQVHNHLLFLDTAVSFSTPQRTPDRAGSKPAPCSSRPTTRQLCAPEPVGIGVASCCETILAGSGRSSGPHCGRDCGKNLRVQCRAVPQQRAPISCCAKKQQHNGLPLPRRRRLEGVL